MSIVEDFLEKTHSELLSHATLREPSVVSRHAGRTVEIEGATHLCFSSNDYLGLATHPELKSACLQGLEKYGTSASASPLVSGLLKSQRQAEQAFAEFVLLEDATFFSSGFSANTGLIPVLAGPKDLVLSDELNHASIIDGSRLSKASVTVYRHNSIEDVARVLRDKRGRFRYAWLVTEAVFSMDGDCAPIEELRNVTRHYDCGLVVDEAHAIGVLGPSGRGLCAQHNVQADILIGPLGKAFGLAGAFVAGHKKLRDILLSKARPLMFSTAAVPAITHAIPTAIALVRDATMQRRQLSCVTQVLCDRLAIEHTRSCIVPLILGSNDRALNAQMHLRSQKIYIQAIRPPTVPLGTARLRIVPNASHTLDDIKTLVKSISRLPHT